MSQTAKEVSSRIRSKFGDIRFEEQSHRYYFEGRAVSLISATTYIKNITTPFDTEKMLKLSSFKKGISKRQLQEEWEFKAKSSSEIGTWVHRVMEINIKHSMDGTEPDEDLLILKSEMPKSDRSRAKNLGNSAMCLFEEIIREWEPADMEFRIYDLGCSVGRDFEGVPCRLAGTVDALFRNRETGEFWIWDWKTNKELKEGYGKNFLSPFEDVKECDLNKFKLQLSLYKEVLERAGVCSIKGLKIGHIMEDGYKVIDLKPMPMAGRIEGWN
jgi:ATP-dependent exoDNAse (exonuclease V) beta subunit